MKRILVIKTGRTHENIRARFGCFEDWMIAALGVPAERVEVVSVFSGETLPEDLAGIAGIVITGSPAMVTERLPWSEETARWLRGQIVAQQSRIPVIGICYGHQLLAHALGGEVGWNPRGREIGTVEIRAGADVAGDPLLGGLPFPLAAHVTHLQSVVELPAGAVLLAHSDLEPHHAFRYGGNVWGVQFHPEFSAEIMRAYVDALAPRMAEEGLDPAAVRDAVGDACAANVLRRFARLVDTGAAD